MFYSYNRNGKESFPRHCFTSFTSVPSSGWPRNYVIFFFLINLSYDITDFDYVNQWMHVAPNILILHVRPRDSQEPQTEIKRI